MMKNMLVVCMVVLVLLAGCAQQPAEVLDEHGCVVSSGESWCEQTQSCLVAGEECTPPVRPGSDRDPHGCIPSAGYTWCQAKNKCLRTWEEPCIAGTHDIAWARSIAEASPCMERGTLTDTYVFNENSLAWWIDMSVENAPGCAPACVVYEQNASAEINWRCTGALPPEAMGSCTSRITGKSMELSRAIEIAKTSMCMNEGTLDANYVCNENTGTWWIDLVPTIPRKGCSPACVVNINSETAEVNYRCTGLIMEGQEPLPAVNEGGSACAFNANGKSISLARAREVASSNHSVCRNIGTLKMSEYLCKADVGVIWFPIIPAIPNEGCVPQCAVNVNSETASVEWKCGTG